MGNQSRVRHSRREFVRAFPKVADAVEQDHKRIARQIRWAMFARNFIIAAAVVGVLVVRCAL